MNSRVAHGRLLAIVGALALTAHAVAVDDGTALEVRLHAARPEILRWETKLLETHPQTSAAEAPIEAIGRIGPRTAVRFGDGRIRWYVVAGFRPVAVATRAVERGDALSASDLAFEERDVIGLGCEAVTIDSAQRWRAARRLASGDAVCVHNVERMPEVERDRPVTLSAQNGSVSVSRVFTAAADARAGERVRLRDRATGTTLTAIVTGPGAARVSGETP